MSVMPELTQESVSRLLIRQYSGVKLYNDVCEGRRDRESFQAALYRSLRTEPG